MQRSQEDLGPCFSFNSYAVNRVAEAAARISDEVSRDSGEDYSRDDHQFDEDGDDEFEFTLNPDALAGEFVYDGRRGPIFPIFNRDRSGRDGDDSGDHEVEGELRIPLRNLFLRERELREPPSCSSSEADDMESIPPGTYCIWRPKMVEASPSRCKKSKSTGSSSKRWKFLDLLRRSNSDGKDSFVFLTPKNKEKPDNSKSFKITAKPKTRRSSGETEKATPPPPLAAHEAFYVRSRAIKEVDKKKSYLPYRQDLVGFFANVNGFGRTFSPF